MNLELYARNIFSNQHLCRSTLFYSLSHFPLLIQERRIYYTISLVITGLFSDLDKLSWFPSVLRLLLLCLLACFPLQRLVNLLNFPVNYGRFRCDDTC